MTDNQNKNHNELMKNYRNSNKLLEDKLETFRLENKDLKEVIESNKKQIEELTEQKHYFKQRSQRSNTLWAKLWGSNDEDEVINK